MLSHFARAKSRMYHIHLCVGASFRKLGLFSAEDDDDGLFESLFATMADTSADFTGAFRELAQVWYGRSAIQHFPRV